MSTLARLFKLAETLKTRIRRLAVVSASLLLAAGLAVSQSVSPTSLSFGNHAVGTASAAKTVTLTNRTKTAVTIASVAIDPSDYSDTSTCPIGPATLVPGASCTVSVMFTPTATGTLHGRLTIVGTSTQRVSLSGNGLIDIAASPTSLAFADTVVSRISSAKSITVKNNESTGITITSISSSLADYLITSDSCPLSPSTLSAGASCKISVVFAPTALGAREGILTISDNASNSPSVSLTGNGIPAVAVLPSTLTFSGQPLGTSSTAQIVTIVNHQSTALTFTRITSSLADFSVSSACPAKLAAGASCNVSATFTPATTGTRTGTLTVVDNANNGPQTVALAGMGLPPTVTSIAVTPSNPSIEAGSAEQFTATGTYTDGSLQNITNLAAWASSNTNAATVSSSGLATGSNAGTATISASYETITGSTALTITASVLSRRPQRVCLTESVSSPTVTCSVNATIPAGSGVVAFITSTIPQTLAAGAVQDSKGNSYTILGNPVSDAYATIYSAYSRLATSLDAGDAVAFNISGSDSWGISLYDIGPVESNQSDVGTTFQNQSVGSPDVINPDTGIPGWWTGKTANTSGTTDMCISAVGLGSANYPGNTGNGTPPPITLFSADNFFKELDIAQTYTQSSPNYTNGGAILTMYSEVPQGTAVQSHVVNYDSVDTPSPAALYCFQEAAGPVKSVPWFTGNYCSGTVSCTIDNVVPGDMLIIGSHSYIALPPMPITVTDSQSETITFDQLAASVGLGLWHISPVSNGGPHTITIDDSVDPNLGMVVVEISGQASGNPVEGLSQTGIHESSSPSVSITTQTPNDLLFGWGRSYFGSDEGEGFNAIRVMPTAEYANAPGVGPQTVTLHPRGTPPWAETGIQAMAIRPAGVSAPAVLSPSFTGNYCIGTYPDTTCTLNNVAAGDMLVISSVAGGSLDQPPVIGDSLGEAIVVDRGNDSNGSVTLSTWHIAPVALPGTHTIRVDGSVTVIVTEYTAQSQANPIDAVTAATQPNGGFASATVQTTQGNDLIYAWCATDGGSGWGDGFAAFWTTPTSEYRMAGPVPGLETATCPSVPNDASSGWVIQELAIRH